MKDIMIWHCYHYARHDTFVLVAETQEALEAKVRRAVIDDWDDEDMGSMPDDFEKLLERYTEVTADTCYFGDWSYTVIDAALCEPSEEKG